MHGKPICSLLGVPVFVRPIAPLAGVLPGLIAYTLARRHGRGRRDSLAIGVANTLLWYEADLIHVVGHIISARLAAAPMDYISWGIFATNGYHNHDVTPRQHIGRSIGGSIASGIAALIYWLIWRMLRGTLPGAVAASGFAQNGLTALGSLAPLRIVDGGVILENLRKL